MGGLDVVLIAWGSLPDQLAAEGDAPAVMEALSINFTNVVAFLAAWRRVP